MSRITLSAVEELCEKINTQVDRRMLFYKYAVIKENNTISIDRLSPSHVYGDQTVIAGLTTRESYWFLKGIYQSINDKV